MKSLLSKPSLDTADHSNYRPVCNSTFIGKVLEPFNSKCACMKQII